MRSRAREQLPNGGVGGRRRKRRVAAIAAAVLVEGLATWRRSGRLGGNLVVRCRDGHLFMTTWIPGVSVKALRAGPWRIQRCPVGGHWTVVTPVRDTYLSAKQLRAAREQRDVRLP